MSDEMIDIESLDTTTACDKPFELQLKHPVSNKPLNIFISVLGRDSTVWREYLRERDNEQRAKQGLAAQRGEPVPPESSEDAEQRGIALLTVCTVAWRNMRSKGEMLPFNHANVRNVYTEQLWIRRQVDKATQDLSNFM